MLSYLFHHILSVVVSNAAIYILSLRLALAFSVHVDGTMPATSVPRTGQQEQ